MYDKTEISNKLKNLIINLDDKYKSCINSIKLVELLVKEYENEFEFNSNSKYFYLKKQELPKAILHININNTLRNFSYNLSDANNDEILASTNSSVITSFLILKYLIDNSNNYFDILITINNYYDKNSDFKELKNILRSSNIINLNLLESNCIAESFSSFTVSSITIPINRYDFDKEKYSYFTIGINGLVGGHSALDLDKVRSNAIKVLMTILRRIKAKVDIEIISFDGGNRYDNIPTSARIEIAVKTKYINDLLSLFEITKNEFLEKNLKLEPDIKLFIEEIDFMNYLPMTTDSYNHLSSFIELSINGAYAVNNQDGQLISSSIISTVRTFGDKFNLVIVYRSLSSDLLNEMVEKTELAAKVSNAKIENKLYIPSWQNKDNYLSDIFSRIYEDKFDKKLKVVKTQYSLDCNIIFNDFNVKMISLGVKYNQVENKFYSKIEDVSNAILLIENVLSEIET